MNRLPLEIKHLIVESTGDLSTESLLALSQVNRQWNETTRPILFKHLAIRLRRGETPLGLLHLLEAKSVLTHVRKLSIVAERGQRPRHIYNRVRPILEEVNFGEKFTPCVGGYDGDWALIIDLIRQLPCLCDLDVLVQNGPPAELRHALSRYHPTCRLSNFPAFTSRGGNFPKKALVYSPLLHAVHVTCYENPDQRVFTEHPDRVLQDIVLLAPQVKHLAMQISGMGSVISSHEYSGWLVFNPQKERGETFVRAELESLSWPLNTKMTAQQFQEWHEIIDFSCLRSWTIGCIEDSTLPRTIVDIHPFLQLTRLTLALYPETDDSEFSPAVKSMFESLSPLKYLCLLGAYDPNFLNTAVLPKHGPTLLELKVHRGVQGFNTVELIRLSQKGNIGPIFSAGDIFKLAAQCPSLREVRICIQRYRGLETDVYAALGQFPSLEILHLALNCVPEMRANEMPVPPRELTDFEKGRLTSRWYDVPTWFSRDFMINCALDESLAKAIFTCIFENQHTRHFSQLNLDPLYGRFQRKALPIDSDFLKELAPTWTVAPDLFTGLMASKSVEPRRHADAPLGDQTLSIFKSIWPADPGANTWPLEWHSWPLQ